MICKSDNRKANIDSPMANVNLDLNLKIHPLWFNVCYEIEWFIFTRIAFQEKEMI